MAVEQVSLLDIIRRELFERLRSCLPDTSRLVVEGYLDEDRISCDKFDVYFSSDEINVIHFEKHSCVEKCFSYDDPEFVEKIIRLAEEIHEGKYH